jgi:hypothetical protein
MFVVHIIVSNYSAAVGIYIVTFQDILRVFPATYLCKKVGVILRHSVRARECVRAFPSSNIRNI